MYGKLFAQMYDGTLGTKGPWQALVTFQQLIILADKGGQVDMTPEAISRRTTIPLDVVALGLTELEKPDPHSRSPAEEGRRIVRLSDEREWGWRIVNYDHYRKIRSQEERREYMRQYQRDRRAKLKDGDDDVNRDVNTSTSGERSQPIAVGSTQYAKADAELRARFPSDQTIAYDHYLSGHNNPDAYRTCLTNAAQKYGWPIVTQSLWEMAGADARFSPKVLEAFCKKLDEHKPKYAAGHANLPEPKPCLPECKPREVEGQKRPVFVHAEGCANA